MNRRYEIANRIKTMRISHGLSQTELARLMQCGQSTIAMYETGKRSPDFETIDSFADVFNVAPHDILYSEAEIQSMINSAKENSLTKDETRLIKAYRAATAPAKEIALETLENHPIRR